MAISLVGSQKTGGIANNTTTISKAFPGNVTAGNLLIIGYYAWHDTGTGGDPILVTDISKSAGTATLGTFTLDIDTNFAYIGTDTWILAAVFSVPVTGSGSCTIQISGAPAGSYLGIGIAEFTGIDVSSSRVDGTNSNSTGSGSPSTTADTGNVTSTAGALFVGSMTPPVSSDTSITEDGAFTVIFENENGDTDEEGSIIYRIVTTSTTDSATWTIGSSISWTCALAVYKAAAGAVSYFRETDRVGSRT